MRKRRKIISRNIVYVTDYVSKRNYAKNKKRRPKSEPTPVTMEELNKRRSEIRLRLLIDNNFREMDYYITLTFKKNPEWEEAKKCIQKFNRSMRAIFKKQGAEYKYIYIAEGKSRIHFHMLINRGIDLYPDMIQQFWPWGLFEIKMYQGRASDAVRIASYFVKEERTYAGKDGTFGRRWNSSTNLIKPKEKVEILQSDFWREDIQAPDGYYVDRDSVFVGVSDDGYPYRIYMLIKIRGETKGERHG